MSWYTRVQREIRAREARAAARGRSPQPPQSEVVRCSAGFVAARCCVGDPWADLTEANAYVYGEPLPPAVIRVAAEHGIDPHALDHHVEGDHGAEPHDDGYPDRVVEAAECVKRGRCEPLDTDI